ncbi:unnamed protein product [Adineta ricciae]|uniref:HAT C-terminal dimerisation domain-containing protein n=2 Tax=Adineta ricciae TaxID=249248 RepID=A0A816GLK7_ADIRI|nr:unnamed protein product [Adineta ricciae]
MNSFLDKCGLSRNVGQPRSKKELSIEQELAKLSSIPKDDYEFDCFWHEHVDTLPKLTSLARRYLSIPSSSVGSESAFSISSYILRKNRLNLSSKNLGISMFLKDKI